MEEIHILSDITKKMIKGKFMKGNSELKKLDVQWNNEHKLIYTCSHGVGYVVFSPVESDYNDGCEDCINKPRRVIINLPNRKV